MPTAIREKMLGFQSFLDFGIVAQKLWTCNPPIFGSSSWWEVPDSVQESAEPLTNQSLSHYCFCHQYKRSCMHACCYVQLFVTLWTVAHRAPLWDSPLKNTGVGCHAVLQGIFPTQGSNPHVLQLLLCRQILYPWATMWQRTPGCFFVGWNWKDPRR